MEFVEDDGPNDFAEIFKIEGNLFDFETPLCKAFNEFNYLLKIDTDLFTFNVQRIKTYKEYELNNNMTGDLEEPWSDNRVPYQLCDHICEPCHFKNGKTKWPTCSSDIDGFCNDGELPGMVRDAREVKIMETHDHTLPQKEKDPRSFTLPCFIHNVCFDKPLVDLRACVSVIPFSTYTNLGLGDLAYTRLTIELANRTIKHPKDIAKNMLVRIGKFIFPIDFIILDIPEDNDVPLILGQPFLSTAYAKINVFKRKITLRVGEEKLVFKSIKPATSIIRKVYMLKEGTNLDSKTELIGEVVNESFDPHYGNYIELNDLDEPLEPRMDQDNNFEPTLNENIIVNEPTSKIDKGDHEEKKLAGTLIDVPIFVGNFSIISGFTIIDDMDVTSGVVLGMPFCKRFVSCQKIMEKFARRDECKKIKEE
ncbi:putative reverse transcriptase domain-containing protein [Tanacetum coccineum]